MASNKIKKVKTFGGAGIGLLTVLGGLLVVYPMITEVEAVQIRVDEKVAENDLLQSRITSLNAIAEQVPQVKAINDDLAAQFPATADIPNLLESLSASANAAGLNSGAFKSIETTVPALVEGTGSTLPSTGEAPAAEAPAEGPVDNTDAAGAAPEAAAPAPGAADASGGDLASMDVTISIDGTPEQLSAFVKSVATGERALLINGFDIAEGEEGGSTLTLTTVAYLYRTLPDPEEAAAAAATPPADGSTAPVDPAAVAPETPVDNTDASAG